MIQIRKGMFETNRSSVHALIISKEQPQGPFHRLFISHGEWGWEQARYSSPDVKISYLCQAIYDTTWDYQKNHEESTKERKTRIDKFLAPLREIGIECAIDDNYFDDFDKNKTWGREGYVDHADTITTEYHYNADQNNQNRYLPEYNGKNTILHKLSTDRDMLLRFIYGDSTLVTTNDNDDVLIEDIYGQINEEKYDDLRKYN